MVNAKTLSNISNIKSGTSEDGRLARSAEYVCGMNEFEQPYPEDMNELTLHDAICLSLA
jgi:hypothetical protein